MAAPRRHRSLNTVALAHLGERQTEVHFGPQHSVRYLEVLCSSKSNQGSTSSSIRNANNPTVHRSDNVAFFFGREERLEVRGSPILERGILGNRCRDLALIFGLGYSTPSSLTGTRGGVGTSRRYTALQVEERQWPVAYLATRGPQAQVARRRPSTRLSALPSRSSVLEGMCCA